MRLIFFFALVLFFNVVFTEDNGLAKTPPMGFLDWERFRCIIDCKNDPLNCISEQLFIDMANVLVSEGYKDVGYTYVNIDDCWPLRERDAQGRLQPDPTRFPHGIKYLADYMHTRGLKLGIYSAYSNYTCGGYPGSYGHVQIDADTFAEWGIDSLKLDGCSSDTSIYNTGYPAFSEALNKTGRPILFSCSWPAYVNHLTFNWKEIGQICNLWRLYDDVQDSWSSILSIINYWGNFQNTLIPAAGPGRWNDPDMLIIGDFSLSEGEAQVQFALWAIFAAPLYISADLRTMKPEYKTILQNKEIIAVNQDPLGKQGRRIKYNQNDGTQVWYRELTGGDVAVALLYTGDGGISVPISFNFADVGISGSAKVRDLFAGSDIGVFSSSYTARVNPHGVVMLRISRV